MTVPALRLLSASSLSDTVDLGADVLVLGVRSTADGPELVGPSLFGDELATVAGSLTSIGVRGSIDEVRRIPFTGLGVRSLALVGLGSGTSNDDLRYAAGSVARQVRGVDSLVLALPAAAPDALLAQLEGAAIGAWEFTAYRTTGEGSSSPASAIAVLDADDVLGAAEDAGALVHRATSIAEAIHTVRDLVATPPSDLYPETFATAAAGLAGDAGLTVTILDEAGLAEGGFGGILGVGQGSSRGPRLVKVEYSPAGASAHLALVGKGITFDSGGLSLKPPVSMVGMKYDMTGAATVLAVTVAAARLQLGIRITAWLCLAENLPSGTAIRPNDVLRIRGGKTVEVLNTDAEGRLVLADGLVAASEEQPDYLIDVATLTGAASVALGTRYVGTMGDDTLVRELVDAGTAAGETLWPMPLPGDLRALLNSDVADIANVKPGNTAAGMLIAGVFLREFVGRTSGEKDAPQIPWAHLDIAGPANNAGGGYGFTGKGPTGVTVRALVTLAERISSK